MKMNVWNRIAQCVVVLVCALALKLYYSSASADQLRWILAPTTACVELVTGATFEFEPHAGYMIADRSFLIAGSCAGVNFLITAFLMLSGRRLLNDWSKEVSWRIIPASAAIAYLVTIVANTTRIAVALELKSVSADIGWLKPGQLHRFEGIFIYFGFLLLLFLVSEKLSSGESQSLLKRSVFPLAVYYATVLAIPLVNGAHRQGSDFWEHSLYVVLIPLLLVLPLAALSLAKARPWESSGGKPPSRISRLFPLRMAHVSDGPPQVRGKVRADVLNGEHRTVSRRRSRGRRLA